MARFSFNLKQIGSELNGQLVVVMPIYNEEANIAEVIAQWSTALRALAIPFQIVALDDGSRDRTLEILLQLEAKDPQQICVVSKPNTGHGSTCRNGYDIAVNSPADWVLQIDSDGQCDPEYFAEFWKRRDRLDCVFGFRASRGDGVGRAMTSIICRLASSIICGQDLKDPNVPYRLMRREALKTALQYIPDSFNIHNVALTSVVTRLPGVRWEFIPIHFPDRKAGRTSVSILKVMTWGSDMLLELLRLRGNLPRSPRNQR